MAVSVEIEHKEADNGTINFDEEPVPAGVSDGLVYVPGRRRLLVR